MPGWCKLDGVPSSGLRLLVYDKSAGGLSLAWAAGAKLYRVRGLLDSARGAASWGEALELPESTEPERGVAEIQFWGHGKWGDARFGAETLDSGSLLRGHPHAARLERLAKRFEPDALFWFRSCETLGARAGQAFARAFADRLGCRVAGHTYVIAALQSGLHALRPGAEPDWDPSEGLLEGTPERPLRAQMSSARAPRTITCFEGNLPSWA